MVRNELRPEVGEIAGELKHSHHVLARTRQLGVVGSRNMVRDALDETFARASDVMAKLIVRESKAPSEIHLASIAKPQKRTASVDGDARYFRPVMRPRATAPDPPGHF